MAEVPGSGKYICCLIGAKRKRKEFFGPMGSRDRTKIGELREAALRVKREGRGILEASKKLSVDHRGNRLQHERMVLNAAFLVANKNQGAFDEAINGLATQKGDRIEFKYLRPVPPYNFVLKKEGQVIEANEFIRSMGIPEAVNDKNLCLTGFDNKLEVTSYSKLKESSPLVELKPGGLREPPPEVTSGLFFQAGMPQPVAGIDRADRQTGEQGLYAYCVIRREEIGRRLRELEAEFVGRLRSVAEKVVLNKPVPVNGADRGEEMVLSAAFLVARERLVEFRQTLN
ncbi:MAG: GvpL/GvpF family gas vesicle protein [Nitrospinota bacterium]